MIIFRRGVLHCRAKYFKTTASCHPRRTLEEMLLGFRTQTTVTTSSSSSRTLFVSSSSPLQRVWKVYSESLHEHPLFTKAIMAAAIFFVSDTASQYITRKDKNSFDWSLSRALSGSTFGIIATVGLHYWWGLLEAVVKKRLPLSTHRLANTATKVLLDQSIKAPLYIYTYFVLTKFLNEQMDGTSDWQKSWREANANAAEMLPSTMLQHWKVWIPVHSFNFYFVPLHHRVLVQNSILVFWSGYLSYLNHQKDQHVVATDEQLDGKVTRRATPLHEKCEL
ncbi:protein Mpv17 [Fistulifera solaris]|uniref:Protein Mpv17 n=1 Tax=Fistulifera solaris TaxID=1519565 RepID=A0A1Z5KHR6_FISSO|nr:protein Mpv17 [Fistulifera solaris]|eukprot:GAX25854.1 protein Mpv17 [Fistulifera solaris]